MDFTATVTATDASDNASTQVITVKVRDVGGIDDNTNTGTGTGTGTSTVATATGTSPVATGTGTATVGTGTVETETGTGTATATSTGVGTGTGTVKTGGGTTGTGSGTGTQQLILDLSLGKKYITNNISSEASLTKIISKSLLDSFIKLIISNKYKNIKISNFGSFSYIESPERIGRNPKTKEEFLIKKQKKLRFKASADLKGRLN